MSGIESSNKKTKETTKGGGVVLGVADAAPIEQGKGVEKGGVYETPGPSTTKPTIEPVNPLECQPKAQKELTVAIFLEMEKEHVPTKETRILTLRQMPSKRVINLLYHELFPPDRQTVSHHTDMMTRLGKLFGPPQSEWEAEKALSDDIPGLFTRLYKKEIVAHIVVPSMGKHLPAAPVVTTTDTLPKHLDPDVSANELKRYCMRFDCFPKDEDLKATFRARGLLSIGREKDLATFKKELFMGTEKFDHSQSRQRGDKKRASRGGLAVDSDEVESASGSDDGVGCFVQPPYRKPDLDHRGDGGERLFGGGGGFRMGRGGNDVQSHFVHSTPSFTAGEFRGSSANNQFDTRFNASRAESPRTSAYYDSRQRDPRSDSWWKEHGSDLRASSDLHGISGFHGKQPERASWSSSSGGGGFSFSHQAANKLAQTIHSDADEFVLIGGEKYVKYVDPATKTRMGKFGDNRDDFVSPTLLNVLRFVKIDFSDIPRAMCDQLGFEKARENFVWNKSQWTPNK